MSPRPLPSRWAPSLSRVSSSLSSPARGSPPHEAVGNTTSGSPMRPGRRSPGALGQGPMTHGGDGPARMEIEREPHPLARRDESPDGASLLRHEGLMPDRSVRLDEVV